jgi:hypothetical protein
MSINDRVAGGARRGALHGFEKIGISKTHNKGFVFYFGHSWKKFR